ncbi:MAG TPA: TPM domain-containing protein [Firmicutes bacterium]|nr:TPM domain-containing protein [Bacillota bacterium]
MRRGDFVVLLPVRRRTVLSPLFLKLAPLLWVLGLAFGLAWSVQAAPVALAKAGQPRLLPPPAEGRVVDAAGMLGAAAVRRLNATLADLEAKNGVEIGVATVPTTEPLTPDQYAVELFEAWGIGKKGQDNGLLILLAQRERRIKVEVGYGLEGIFPDGRVGRLLDDYALPALKEGRYGAGLVALVDELARIAAAEYDGAGAGVRGGSRGGPAGLSRGLQISGLLPGLTLFALLFILLTGVSLGLARPVGHRCPRCRGRMIKEGEETLRTATADADGLARVHYRCTRCGYERVAEIVLPMLLAGELVERRRRFRGPFGPFGGPFGGGFGDGGFGGGSGGGGFGGFGGGSSGGGGAGRNF